MVDDVLETQIPSIFLLCPKAFFPVSREGEVSQYQIVEGPGRKGLVSTLTLELVSVCCYGVTGQLSGLVARPVAPPTTIIISLTHSSTKKLAHEDTITTTATPPLLPSSSSRW